MVIKRFDVYLINLDPTTGSEIQKNSPVPRDLAGRTVIVAPMTSKGSSCPTRVACKFQGKQGQIVLDQIRAVDKTRLIKGLGKIDKQT